MFPTWIRSFVCVPENQEIDSLTKNLNVLQAQLKQEQSQKDFYKSQAMELRNDLLDKEEVDAAEEFWNNKRPKNNRFYKRYETDGKYDIDVRNYFMPYDDGIPTVKGKTNDIKALSALELVKKTITYISDKKTYGYDEYWAYAYQTLKRRKGDCEDGAILLANIMLKSGIPYWRIRLNAGDVKGGGHAYVTYCRESDNQFVTLDWCYWYDHTEIKYRTLHKDQKDYYGIWFSCNLKYTFGSGVTYAGFKVRKRRNM